MTDEGLVDLLTKTIKRAEQDARKGSAEAASFLDYLRTGQEPEEQPVSSAGATIDHEAQFEADTGWTVEEFAARVGISAQALRASWAGTTPEGERLERRRRMADALGVMEEFLPEEA